MSSVEETPLFSIENFQGPLDLLLHLIRKDEMDIFDIPIIKLVEQYEEHLQKMRELNLTIASEYIYMLSILLNIKAKMLLGSEKEEEKDEDPRNQLVSQIMEYEKVKKIADELKEIYTIWGGTYARERNNEEIVFLEDLSIYQIIEAFNNIIKKLKLKESPPFISAKRPNIKEMMVSLLNFLPKNNKPFPFFDFLYQLKSGLEVITAFLALLELIRIGCVKYLIKNGKDDIFLVYFKDLPNDFNFEEYT